MILSILFSVFPPAAWLFRWTYTQLYTQQGFYDTAEENIALIIIYIISNPLSFAPAFFVASIVPSAVGTYKFLLALTMFQQRQEDAKNAEKSPLALQIKAIIGFINLTASIATIILAFKYFKNI